MGENLIDAALRISEEKRRVETGRDAAIESLAESDLPQQERKRMVAEWRELRLL